MSKIILTAFMSLTGLFAQAQEVQINVTDLPEKGTLNVGVFNSQENFNKHKIVVGDRYTLDGKETEKTFTFSLPEGNYGVAIFLDFNGNNQFDYGIDSYAFSNDYQPKEYPKFDRFKLT